MRQDCRRRDGVVPSPWRSGDLRGAGAARAGFRLALSADRGPGQFRQHRRRQRRRLSLHRGAHDRRRPPSHGGRRGGRRRLARQLFRRHERAGGHAVGRAEPARQRRAGHRGRHGDVDPAAQHRRTLRRGALPHRSSRRRGRSARGVHAGPGFSHRRNRHRRKVRDSRDLPRRPRRLSSARALDEGGGGPRRLGRGRDPNSLWRAEVAIDRGDRQTAQ